MTNTQIISEIAIQNRFFARCKKIACCGLEMDLYQELLLILYSLEKLPEIYSESWFDGYCNRIIFNLYTNKNSGFFRNYRHTEANIEPENLVITDCGIESKCIEAEINKMDWFSRDIFYVVELCGSARKASKETNIPLKSILSTLRVVKEKIKNSESCLECLKNN